MAKLKDSRFDGLEPQRSSAAQFLTYIAANGVTNEKFEIRYEGETIWMSQKMLAAVYGVEVPNVAYHLKKIFEDAELDPASTIKEILIVADNGKNYSVKHYNLKVIIALGFKINNARAVQFRKWANEVVEKFTIQGWALDEARLKNGHTAAQIVYTRADAAKEHMGLTSWENAPDGKIQKSDVTVAKNYLTEPEVTRLNRMTNAYIDYAENMAEEHVPLMMEDWVRVLGKFIDFWSQSVPERCVEEVTAALAKAHAEAEFAKYRVVQDQLFMSDYDRYLLALEEEAKRAKDNSDEDFGK